MKLKSCTTCNILFDLFSLLFFLSFICLSIPSQCPTSVGAWAHRDWKMHQLSQCSCLPWLSWNIFLTLVVLSTMAAQTFSSLTYRFIWAWRRLKIDIWVWNWISPTHVTNLILNLYPSLIFLSPCVQFVLILPLLSFWVCSQRQQLLKIELLYCCLRKGRQQLSEQRNL